jgi:predicted dehydrogenase
MNSRREFIKKTSLTAASVAIAGIASPASFARIRGANDRLNIAFIGCYRRFNAYLDSLPALTNYLNVLYVCDVDQVRMADAQLKVLEKTGSAPKKEEDIRKILEDKTVDAVFIAMPDHWHATAAIMALKAGKHVYLEKPCAHNPREGELLVDFQKKYNKVVQMGTQQRSSLESREIINEIHKGIIGDAYMAKAFYSNGRGMVPLPKAVTPPETLNWELFQGPAPRETYMDIYFDYNWHWFWQYGTAETGNNAVHELDICRWALQKDYPAKVYVNAVKQHFKEDGWQMYDTMDASFVFEDGKSIQWDGKSRNNYQSYGTDRGSIIYGTTGTVTMTRNGYKVFDRDGKLVRERKTEETNQTTQPGGAGSLDALHIINFVDSIRGKAEKQHMKIDDGAKSTLMGHLANISYRVGEPLEIDPMNGHVLNNAKAMKLWQRTYEKGWEL